MTNPFESSPTPPDPEKKGEDEEKTPPIVKDFMEAWKKVDKEMLEEDEELKGALGKILERAKEEMDEIVKAAEKRSNERN